jgi:hypothetical protein
MGKRLTFFHTFKGVENSMPKVWFETQPNPSTPPPTRGGWKVWWGTGGREKYGGAKGGENGGAAL